MTQDALRIEREGYPFPTGPGWMGRHERPLEFAERQTYYSWYCVRLSAALGLNYVPNPIRMNLFRDRKFLNLPIFPNFQQDILQYFEEVRTKHAESVRGLFQSLRVELDLPLVYNYVKSQAANVGETMSRTMKLRASPEATGFRKFCNALEQAAQKRDLAAVDEAKEELYQLGQRWSQSLARAKAKKTWTVNWFIGTDFHTPWFNLGAVDRKPHCVFLHELLAKSR